MVVLTAIVVAGALWLGDRQGSGPDRPSPRRGTNSVAAYELYLHGIDPTLTRTDEGVRQAGRYFEQAIAADSTYAAAYAELSFVHLRMAMAADPGMPLSSLYALAEAAARKAVTLDDSLPEAHQALARARMAMFDFASAETEIRRAIALDPMRTTSHLTLATLHLWQRRPPEALADSRHALELDPLAPIAHAEVARALFASRRYDEALAQLERIEAVRPPVRWAVLIAGLCYSAKRMWPEAVATLRPLAEEGDPMILAFLGHTLARAGQRDEAERILTDLDARRERTGAGTFEVAVVHAGLGDLDQAFERLDASIDDYSLKPEIMSPLFEDLHRDPRFRRLSDRLGLPER
jgi:tetratricopeptide (TPR) repeat protein